MMKAVIFSYTRNGAILSLKVKKCLEILGYCVETFVTEKYIDVDGSLKKSQGCSRDAQKAFKEADAIIYIGACGIAIRAISPLIKDKTVDPAVIDIDEGGNFVIALLSGHIGGANKLTRFIAKEIKAIPVITTATDVNGLFAVDEWATTHNCAISSMKVAKDFAAALVDKNELCFTSTYKIKGSLPKGLKEDASGDMGLVISENTGIKPYKTTLTLVPKIYTLGIGCKKETQLENIENLVLGKLQELKISIEAIKEICSVDLKKNEKGLLDFAKKYKRPIRFFSAKELKDVPGTFSSSPLVEKVVGVGNVCERAAVCGSNSKVVLRKTTLSGVTMALAKEEYIIDFTTK